MPTTVHIALVKGINLGAHRRVPMAELRAALHAAGFATVRTLLASGNVVLRSSRSSADTADAVRQVLSQRFGVTTAVLVRTPEQIAAALEEAPFSDVATDGSKLLIGFCSATPTGDAVAALQDRIGTAFPGGDRWSVSGDRLYQWCPGGISTSPFFAIDFERPLAVTITSRNRNTVEKLLALATS